jgi:hypothetical protein
LILGELAADPEVQASYSFTFPQSWLGEVERTMRVTLRDLLRNCRLALKKFLNKRDKWVKEWAGQVSWLNTNGKPDRVKGTASRMTPESHKMKVS